LDLEPEGGAFFAPDSLLRFGVRSALDFVTTRATDLEPEAWPVFKTLDLADAVARLRTGFVLIVASEIASAAWTDFDDDRAEEAGEGAPVALRFDFQTRRPAAISSIVRALSTEVM